MGDLSEALNDLDRALQLQPDSVHALRLLEETNSCMDVGGMERIKRALDVGDGVLGRNVAPRRCE